jgi:PhzF family phenazine biosynthesis protein
MAARRVAGEGGGGGAQGDSAQATALMRYPIYQLDAFTPRRFAGNPAAVVVMDAFPEDAAMQAIAAENNLAETAFLVRDGDDYRLRWFTPTVEVPLCGHATLASGAVVMEHLETGRKRVVFDTRSGPLTVTRVGDRYTMDLPARASSACEPPAGLAAALGAEPREVFVGEFNYMAILDSAGAVRALQPDLGAIARLDRGGVVATAAGDEGFDFVSRYFAPAKGIPEDPVTGGAHCMLTPFWAARLGKQELRAYQASARGGEIACRLRGDRVELEGACAFYLKGEIEV